MFKRDRHGADKEHLERELREMVLNDRVAIFHGLYCPNCGRDPWAEAVLNLVGWDELQFLTEVENRYGRPVV